MSLNIIIIALGVLIFSSHAFNELFSKTKIPNVLLLLLIGIVIGPISGVITKDFFGELGSIFTTITLIVILFESGSSLKIKELKSAIGSATLITLMNFILTVAVTTGVSVFFLKFDLMSALFVGSIIGGTSSAVVIPMVRQLKMGEKSTSVLILESALSDVLCLVVGLAMLDGIALGEISTVGVFAKMGKAFLFALLMGIASGVVWSLLISLVRSVKNSMFTTLAFVFIVYGIVEMLGLNGGIAVLSFGIMLGNIEILNRGMIVRKVFKDYASGFNSNERDFFSEVVFIMQTYFFVYVGISLQFASFGIYLTATLLVLMIILMRIPVVSLFVRKSVSKAEKAMVMVMTPKGLVPAVLASLPLQRGLPHGTDILDLGYSVVLISIVLCSLLVIILSVRPGLFDKNKVQPVGASDGDLTGDVTQV
ncbi:MAG: cation:proton antiporter [Prolixibacteraceae bacterium]|nr:cation:proton antiporter [Prolixibacteraceae bacterium]